MAIDMKGVDPKVVILTGNAQGKSMLMATLAGKGRYQLLQVDEHLLSSEALGVCVTSALSWTKSTLAAVITAAQTSQRALVIDIDYRSSIGQLSDLLPPAMVEAVIDEIGQVDVMLVLHK